MSEHKNIYNMSGINNFSLLSMARGAESGPRRSIFTAIFFSLSLFAFVITAQANQDVLLVLDNSGSMRKNDPEFLAKSAVREFIESLSSETRAGVVIFDQRITLAVPLVQLDGPK